jgi:hypothetical protein
MHRPAFSTPAPGPWAPAPAPVPVLRRVAARALRRAGAWMRHTADALARPVPGRAPLPQTLPLVEFHAEAGAPEGALYVDGHYVGSLGVTRL